MLQTQDIQPHLIWNIWTTFWLGDIITSYSPMRNPHEIKNVRRVKSASCLQMRRSEIIQKQHTKLMIPLNHLSKHKMPVSFIFSSISTNCDCLEPHIILNCITNLTNAEIPPTTFNRSFSLSLYCKPHLNDYYVQTV